MPKLRLYAAIGEYQYLPDLYDLGTLAIATHTTTNLTLEDTNGMKIIFVGTAFKYKSGVPDDGQIGTVRFVDSDGDLLAKYTGGKYDFGGLAGKLNDIWSIASFLNAGNDIVTGSNISDDLFAGDNGGNDTINGLGGNDYIKGFSGNNSYNGGAGYDTLTYDESIWDKAHAKKGLILDVAAGTARNPWGGTDHFKNMEQYRGSHLADKITGSNAQYEEFGGLGGADVINGGKGTDRLSYDHDDHYSGGHHGIVVDLTHGTVKDGFGKTDQVSGIEEVVGTQYGDTFAGDKHDNYFRGLAGTDSFDGKGGQDTASFYSNQPDHGVNVDMTLATGKVIDDGYGNTEELKSIENIVGSTLADTIKLGAANGYAGGDRGSDRLISGAGKHYLEGGDDADTFVFLTAPGIGTKSNHDIIADFSQADHETIDLSAISTMIFIGTDVFSGGGSGGEVRYQVESGNTFVYGDTDGNGTTDFALELRGVYTLTANDFVLV